MTTKKILGLDLGSASIGWAFVKEGDSLNDSEASSIEMIGTRIIQYDTFSKVDKLGNVSESKSPVEDFKGGRGLSPNANRTKKRAARKNLQRFKQRRDNLISTLKDHKIIDDTVPLNEYEKGSTFSTYKLRSKAASQRIEKDELAKVLLMLNKKRGYRSSRKAKNEEEGQAIDGMRTAKRLYDENITPGQLCLSLLQAGYKVLPDFYRSDLQNEFDAIWLAQRKHYPQILKETLKETLRNKNKGQTWKICEQPFGIVGVKRSGTKKERQLEVFQWRNDALSTCIDLEMLAVVLQEINGQISNSSGYLGAISDRSKELYFNKETIGQNLYRQLRSNPHARLKNQVFYRQDYLDEFEQIWETQKQFHPELTIELKEIIRDTIIFYQRKLKSQKSLIGFCEFESQQKEVVVDGISKKKTIGARVAPKSSPLFQEFKIWQNLNALEVFNKETGEVFSWDQETRQMLFDELNLKGNLSKQDVLRLLVKKPSGWDLNFEVVEGNRTNQVLYEAYQKIAILEGSELIIERATASEIKADLKDLFASIGVKTDVLDFDAEMEGSAFNEQTSFQLWHLLYSFEEDPMKPDSIQKLYEKLTTRFGFTKEHATIISAVTFQADYSSLSTKAIKKIFPYIKEHRYDKACALAGYNHSSSLTKEEINKRPLLDKLDLLPKNSLRNPVVEKILNQMVNVVNTIINNPALGKPDEIRLELARELKKSSKERQEMTAQINSAKTNHEGYRKILQKEFGIKNPTRNDIIRYKLYLELSPLSYHTPYSNTYIPREKLFSKEFDIEHIIPKSKLFDDSFSNKTLELRSVNLEKGEVTAADFVKFKYGESGYCEYAERVELLKKGNSINKAKYNKLLMPSSEIPDGFIERDLRESQYIARKAKQMLESICRTVNTTTGSVTDKLREDWGLVNVMQELNLDKYRMLGLTEQVEKKDGTFKERITDWSKRNDHRNHAADALIVAFTRYNHIQYLNHLNARKNEQHEKHNIIQAIEAKETYRDEKGKRKFKPPMQNFRAEAKTHLERVLVSYKAKNKVVTRNKNKIKGKDTPYIELTPRGQLHKETVYGKIKRYDAKEAKISTQFDLTTIEKVARQSYRDALRARLEEHNGDPKKAFGGKNSPAKKPVYTSEGLQVPEKVKLVWLEEEYTIKKEINADNFNNEKAIEKIIDVGIRRVVMKRLKEYDGNAKEAFSNLDQNPIWLKKGEIPIKRVTISGVKNATPLHYKKDHFGKEILDTDGKTIPVDFVSTGNNHHVSIFCDEKGNYHEKVVSFSEAVERARQGMPVIQRHCRDYWKFMFTMKQNEYFVFPSADFDPFEMDLLNPDNYGFISPHLFRVQSIGEKDYWFRHHLDSNTDKKSEAAKMVYKRLRNPDATKDLVKVRVNHIGQIVKVGEY